MINKMQQYSLAVLAGLFLLVCIPDAMAGTGTGLTTFYGIGGGAGLMNMSGDFIEHHQEPVLQVGWDANSQHVFAVIQSGFAVDNSFKWVNTLIGFGFPWVKIGTGFWRLSATTPTQSNVNLTSGTGVTINTDGSRRTTITNQAIPIYLRFTPWRDHDNLFDINFWRSIDNLGRESIPVTIFGQPANFVSEWDHEGVIQGASLRYTHRITRHLGVNVDLLYMGGRNDHSSLPVAVGPNVPAPVVRWHTSALIISAQMVF